MMYKTKVKKWGGSYVGVIPAEVVKVLHIEEGEEVLVDVKEKISMDGFGILSGVKKKFVRDEKDDLRV